jgi:anaerobic dimethyl sulfoxide reductase subunit B (iron-sulfur subunit)
MGAQLGFFFDARACIGCKACVLACKDKNHLPSGTDWRRVIDFGGGEWVEEAGHHVPRDMFTWHVSVSCMHCADPPCVDVCTGTALRKDDQGIVSIDDEACIACRECEQVCPYGALHYDAQRRVMTKCDLCRDLLAAGERPACVAICPQRCLDAGPVEALRARYGELDRLDPVADGDGIGPAVVFIPHERDPLAGSGRILNRIERATRPPDTRGVAPPLRVNAGPADLLSRGGEWSGAAVMLRVLARVFSGPPDRETLALIGPRMQGSALPFAAHQPVAMQGLDRLRSWFAADAQTGGVHACEDLGADYTRLFDGAVEAPLTPPWESYWCSPDQLLFQPDTAAVRAAYRKHGLRSDALHRLPDDHVSLEIAFCAELAERACDSLGRGDEAAAASALRAQGEFLAAHLLRWAPRWCAHTRAASRTAWYAGWAEVTAGVLRELGQRHGIAMPPDLFGLLGRPAYRPAAA